MGHTPYGYRIENGQAIIDEAAAATILNLYKNYLSGMGLSDAAKKAGLKTYHGTAKLLELQKELLKKANNCDAYDNIAEEIFQLRELKAKSETDSVIRDEKLARITELCDFLKEQPSEIIVFDESLVCRMLQKVAVFEDRFTVEFKSGVRVDIEG
ncbi:MAG: hypothetical protein ACRCSR_08980 [Bacteroidales bacterium]